VIKVVISMTEFCHVS